MSDKAFYVIFDVWLSEDDLERLHNALAISDDDLRAKLATLGVRVDQLVQPFKTDYPL